jgi:hypothetical protein
MPGGAEAVDRPLGSIRPGTKVPAAVFANFFSCAAAQSKIFGAGF